MDNSMMIYSEAKEIVDFFVRHLVLKVPRFAVNCFAQELSNSLLAHSKDHSTLMLNLPENSAGYYILRDADKIAPLILDALKKTATSIQEFMAYTPDLILLKIEAGKLNWFRKNESEIVDLCPLEEKIYFEIPSRVFKAAVDQRSEMLTYSQFTDISYPSDFIPLALIIPDVFGKRSKLKYKFRAVGIPVSLFSAEQLNKTTFGSYNVSESLDSSIDNEGNQSSSSLLSNAEHIDFFAPGWWERIVKSDLVDKHAVKSKSGKFVQF